MNKVANYYNTLVSVFPDALSSRTFSRSQMLALSSTYGIKIPGEVRENNKTTVGRGLYVIPANIELKTIPMELVASNSTPNYLPVSEHVLTPIAAAIKSIHPSIIATSFIPNRDSNFVPFGAFNDLEDVIKTKQFFPVYITGLSGNGKSTMVEQICAKHKLEMIRVNLNALSDEDQLIGSKTLEDGNVIIVEGPVLIAMRRGCTLLVDEIDAGSANSLLCIQSVLEGKPYYFKLKNEIIIPTKGFNIIATGNTKGKGNDDGQFIGTNVLNEAFLERFGVTLEQEYPTPRIELKIILNFMHSMGCVDEVFASALAKWADVIRRTYEAGGIDEIMSTRRIIHIVTAFSIYKNKKKAVELCCNRFDPQTKAAFIDMFNAVIPDEIIPEVFVADDQPTREEREAQQFTPPSKITSTGSTSAGSTSAAGTTTVPTLAGNTSAAGTTTTPGTSTTASAFFNGVGMSPNTDIIKTFVDSMVTMQNSGASSAAVDDWIDMTVNDNDWLKGYKTA